MKSLSTKTLRKGMLPVEYIATYRVLHKGAFKINVRGHFDFLGFSEPPHPLDIFDFGLYSTVRH